LFLFFRSISFVLSLFFSLFLLFLSFVSQSILPLISHPPPHFYSHFSPSVRPFSPLLSLYFLPVFFLFFPLFNPLSPLVFISGK
jgi:hypothetical protein